MHDPSIEPGGREFVRRAILSVLLECGPANSKRIATVMFGQPDDNKTAVRIVRQLLNELEDMGEVTVSGKRVWRLS